MIIIDLSPECIAEALELVESVFMEFEAPDYDEEGIAEFHKFIERDSILEKIKYGGLRFKGCRIDGKLAGVIAVRDYSHIALLFVAADFHRNGIGTELFNSTADESRRREVTSITVNSSPFALPFYRRIGFVETDVEKTVHGIRFTPMFYSCSPGA